MKARWTAAGALLLVCGAPARAAGIAGDAGTTLTAGSGGYHRIDVFADADSKRGDLDPYAWGDYSADNDVTQFGAGGGAWKELGGDWSVKGGLGGYVGRVHGTGQEGTSFLAETALERALGAGAAGVEYRLTDGTIGGPSAIVRYGDTLRGRGQARGGPGATATLPSYTFSDVSAYGRIPLGATKLGLRVGEELPSYSRSIQYEEVSLKVPLGASFRARPAATFEQGAVKATYFSLSGMFLF